VSSAALSALREGGVVITARPHQGVFHPELDPDCSAVIRGKPANLEVVFVENYYDPNRTTTPANSPGLPHAWRMAGSGLNRMLTWSPVRLLRYARRRSERRLRGPRSELGGLPGPGEGLPIFVGIKQESTRAARAKKRGVRGMAFPGGTQMHAGFACNPEDDLSKRCAPRRSSRETQGPSAKIRDEAIRELAKLGDHRAVPLLIKALKDQDSLVRNMLPGSGSDWRPEAFNRRVTRSRRDMSVRLESKP